MTPRNVHDFQEWFEILQTTGKSQVAMMRLDVGQATGEKPEEHPESDQILLVLEGHVSGTIGDQNVVLDQGQFVVIPAATPHRFVNESEKPALTFNVYAPPAYPPDTKG